MPMNARLLRPRTSGIFDPRTIAGLALWLDSADTTTVLNSVSPETPATLTQTVRQWKDKSGQNRHANQTSGTLQPTRQSTGISFDGTNDFLDLSAHPAITQNVPFFGIFVAGRIRALGSQRPLFSSSISGVLNSSRYFLQAAAGTALQSGGRRLDADTAQVISSVANAPTSDSVMACAVNYSAASISQRINGVTDGSSNSFQTPGNTSDTASLGIFVGRFFTFYANMDVREILIYNQVLSDSQVSAVERYLAAKWGITLS